jgi:hypothetical protein
MSTRSPVSNEQNIWFDSSPVDDSDLSLEQNYNNATQTGFINNHVGTGVLPDTLNQATLFDSTDPSFIGSLFDGKALYPLAQPTDSNLGNQLEIEISGANLTANKSIKVAIIGLDFNSDLQYDTFVFKANEKQITKKHYTSIALILTNDFIGTTAQSFNLALTDGVITGKLTIKEAKPFALSRDTVMTSQTSEPNLFFRDFFVAGNASLSVMLKAALPLYNIDALNITTGYKSSNILLANDVSSQIGQKFVATTNNIQKITALMSVQNSNQSDASNLVWTGDLVVSVYALQTSVSSSEVLPNLAIDFTPSNIPIAQLSFNYASLQAMGITLDSNPQPVDFIFSNTSAATGNAIVPGNYYTFTFKRVGSASTCDLMFATGSNESTTTWVSVFTGATWVDLTDESLWHQVHTDSVKITDGQAYESGHGITIPKTQPTSTSVDSDFSFDSVYFTGNTMYSAVVSANIKKEGLSQDTRTGQPVYTRQKFVPNVSLLSPVDMTSLSKASDPFVIGTARDYNQKYFDATTALITATNSAWTYVKNQMIFKVITDSSDPKYNQSVNSLMNSLLAGDLVNAKFTPNTANQAKYYRVGNAELITMVYGDLNGDGIVDESDLELLNGLTGLSLTASPPAATTISGSTAPDGTVSFVNGYDTFVNPFVSASSVSFIVANKQYGLVYDGYTDGTITPNPSDPTTATFTSSFDFYALNAGLTGGKTLEDCNLIVLSNSTTANYGGFSIASIPTTSLRHSVTIKKNYVNSNKMLQIMAGDIDGDFAITSNDGYLMNNYLNKVLPFPATSSPANKIGTTFNVIRITAEPFNYTSDSYVNRTDDYPSYQPNRAATMHASADLFKSDTSLENVNYGSLTISVSFTKQLTWRSNLVKTSSLSKIVPSAYTTTAGFRGPPAGLAVRTSQSYPLPTSFDPGTVNKFVPNDLIIGAGQLKNVDGTYHKVDFEVSTITLEIPTNLIGTEKTISIFDAFVSDYTGSGITRLGYRAMKFADGTFVSTSALTKNQIRFDVSMQSFSPNLDAVDNDGYSGIVIDNKMGVSIDYATGLLTLNFADLYQDIVLQTLNTKVQVAVFMKKGGFNNTPTTVSSTELNNLLGLI